MIARWLKYHSLLWRRFLEEVRGQWLETLQTGMSW